MPCVIKSELIMDCPQFNWLIDKEVLLCTMLFCNQFMEWRLFYLTAGVDIKADFSDKMVPTGRKCKSSKMEWEIIKLGLESWKTMENRKVCPLVLSH